MISVKQSLIYLSLTILVTLVLEYTYFSDEKEIYRALKEKVERGEEEVFLSEVTTFEWDTAYFFGHFQSYHDYTYYSEYERTNENEFLIVFYNYGEGINPIKYDCYDTPLFMYDDEWETKRLKLEELPTTPYLAFDCSTEFSFGPNTKFKLYTEGDKIILVLPPPTWDKMDYL